jgi:Xaa-Pro dipeptidase
MSYFSLGDQTFKVPMQMHAENRLKLLQRLVARNANPDGFVLLQGGDEKNRHDTDHTFLFRQESFFQYLFGVKEPGFYGGIHVGSRKSVLFIPKLPQEYVVWLGRILPAEYFKKLYEVDEVYFTDEIEQTLNNLSVNLIYTLHGKNTDSGSTFKEATFPGIHQFKKDNMLLFPELVECRVIKSEKELNLMRYVNKVCSEAHIEVMKSVKADHYEYQAEARFLFETYFKGGCRHQSYTCICASGENGAILHYGHSGAPNDRQIKGGDMLVFDMGAEYHCYGSDVTRSFPVNGKFTEKQRKIYQAVLDAQESVIKSIKPGVEWVEMHSLALKIIVTRLKEYNILIGDINELMEKHIGALFMPHGLGHLLGIDTHDCGGYATGANRMMAPSYNRLRVHRPLQAGMVITVEPGIYFNIPYLEQAFTDPEKAKYLNKQTIMEYWDFGGVRIEDDIIVTEHGAENMTAAPRTVEDIESLMATVNLNN